MRRTTTLTSNTPQVGDLVRIETRRVNNQAGNQTRKAIIHKESGRFAGWITRDNIAQALEEAEGTIQDVEQFSWAAGGSVSRRGSLLLQTV